MYTHPPSKQENRKFYDNCFRKHLPLISTGRVFLYFLRMSKAISTHTSGKNSDLGFKLTGYCKTFVVVGPQGNR